MQSNNCNYEHSHSIILKLVIDTRFKFLAFPDETFHVYGTYIELGDAKISLHDIKSGIKFTIPNLPITIVILTKDNEITIQMTKRQSENLVWFLNEYPYTALKHDCRDFTRYMIDLGVNQSYKHENNIIISNVEPLSSIRINNGKDSIHGALYITNDVFLSKFGYKFPICGINKDEMLKAYPGEFQYSRRCILCHFCKTERINLDKCGRCRKALYCSRECQISHWKDHKLDCNPKDI